MTSAEYEREIARSANMIYPDSPVDAFGYACSSGSFGAVGDRIEAGYVTSGRAPMVDTREAIFAALDTLAPTGIALLTPYVEELHEIVRKQLGARGFDVALSCALAVESNDMIARISQEALLDIAGAMLKDDRVDSLLVCCNALRIVSLIDRLEEEYGKPVVASNQALVWRVLRRAGCRSEVENGGILLRA
ncbi:hypothetical protein DMH01_38175 [Amycolatopsis sp. WAC 04182]|nr:hypothetical protein DMH01_38175 [Amycolatopsis sp. WAC 04182]